MSIVVPNTAEILMCQWIVNAIPQPSGVNRMLRLFTSDTVPSVTTLISDLSEAAVGGYAPITLLGSGWTPVITSGVGKVNYARQTFAFTVGLTLYGYYVTTIEATPQLLWAERFIDGPYTLPTVGGGQIGVTPTFTMSSPITA